MDDAQRDDTRLVFAGIDNAGLLDFVAAWYVKAAHYMKSVRPELSNTARPELSDTVRPELVEGFEVAPAQAGQMPGLIRFAF